MLLLTAKKKWSDNMIKIEGGSTAGKIFWSNFEAFQFKHDLYVADIARLIYNRTEYGHNRKSPTGISSNLYQLLKDKNNKDLKVVSSETITARENKLSNGKGIKPTLTLYGTFDENGSFTAD